MARSRERLTLEGSTEDEDGTALRDSRHDGSKLEKGYGKKEGVLLGEEGVGSAGEGLRKGEGISADGGRMSHLILTMREQQVRR